MSPERPSAPRRSLPGLGWVRRLYDWVLRFAETPQGPLALFGLAFIESSFFPIPPDVLLVALALGNPRRAWFLAGLCTVGSVLGGVLGWWIGHALFDAVGQPIVAFYRQQETFLEVQRMYQGNAFAAIAVAGFTPIPYKVFTIAAGVFQVSIPVLIAASVFSRGARFFLVAGMIRFGGERVRGFIERYFDLLTVVFTALLIAGVAALRWLR